MADYGNIIYKSLSFGFRPKRWLPLFVLMMAALVPNFIILGGSGILAAGAGLNMVYIAAGVGLMVLIALIGVWVWRLSYSRAGTTGWASGNPSESSGEDTSACSAF